MIHVFFLCKYLFVLVKPWIAWQAHLKASKAASLPQPPVNSGPSSGSGIVRGTPMDGGGSTSMAAGVGNVSGGNAAASAVFCLQWVAVFSYFLCL